jgi:hypothetical protein
LIKPKSSLRIKPAVARPALDSKLKPEKSYIAIFQLSAMIGDLYPITRKVDQKCLGKNTNQLQGKNYKVKIQTKYKRE